MKLYLLKQDCHTGPDYYRVAVVAAEHISDAIHMHPCGGAIPARSNDNWVNDPIHVYARLIGTADRTITEPEVLARG